MESTNVTAAEVYHPGLEGVIAGETAVSTVTGGLRYRGYPVVELADQASFDEVAYLLLHGDLPTGGQLKAFRERLAQASRLPTPLTELFRQLPAQTNTMDVLRTAVSVLAHFDPDIQDNSPGAGLRKAERLLAQIPIAVAQQYRRSRGLAPVAPRVGLSLAANLLYMIRGSEPGAAEVRAFDVSLILYAEHEFNASTFTARVVCSTESDLHSAIVAAIGALKGKLHGGANEQVMDLLQAAGGPATAERWIQGALARKERIMGFGHRVYKTGDVRAGVLKQYACQMSEAAGQAQWEATAAIIEKVLEQEKHLFPNLDWPAGRLYHALGLEIPLYTPIFVCSRVAGWSAHIIEQQQHNRLIRPRSRYTGPEVRHVVPLSQRG
jgi:citrate synthase